METYIPLSLRELGAFAEGTEQSVGMHPLATGIISTAIDIATDVAREVVLQELKQPEQQPLRNQKEQLEIAIAQMQLDILEIQSPSRVARHIFGQEEQRQADMQQLTAVRTELRQITPTSSQPIYMESRACVMQQAMGVKSSMGMPVPTLEAVRTELSQIIPPPAILEA